MLERLTRHGGLHEAWTELVRAAYATLWECCDGLMKELVVQVNLSVHALTIIYSMAGYTVCTYTAGIYIV